MYCPCTSIVLKSWRGRYLNFLPGYNFHIPPPLRALPITQSAPHPVSRHCHKSITRGCLAFPIAFGLLHSPGTMASALHFHGLQAIAFSRLALHTPFGLFHSPGRKTIRNDFAPLPFTGGSEGHGPRFAVRAFTLNRKIIRNDFRRLAMGWRTGLTPQGRDHTFRLWRPRWAPRFYR